MKNETRLKLEKANVRAIVSALISAGYALNVNNGGDEAELPAPSDNVAKVMKVTWLTDEEHLQVFKDGEQVGWVFLVYGNEPEYVVNDYTMNLQSVLEPVIDSFE